MCFNALHVLQMISKCINIHLIFLKTVHIIFLMTSCKNFVIQYSEGEQISKHCKTRFCPVTTSFTKCCSMHNKAWFCYAFDLVKCSTKNGYVIINQGFIK